ncbi:hypothetical protein ACIQ1D_19520 [Lysinibacillus xylanilyticus]|uniref:hypothetical protein n=1 Tax=Lysinibacillus xylanilyticus TaxID=582475 RepID=UPI00381F8F86
MNYYIMTFETNDETVNVSSFLFMNETDDNLDNRWRERAFELAYDSYFDIHDEEANESFEIYTSYTSISKNDFDWLKKEFKILPYI